MKYLKEHIAQKKVIYERYRDGLKDAKSDATNSTGNYNVVNGVGEITLDLGSVQNNLSKFRVHLVTTAGSTWNSLRCR